MWTSLGSTRSTWWWRMSLVVGVLSLLPRLADLLTRKSFETHPGGIVLVTGSTSGIGHETTTYLLEQGFEVFAGGRTEASLKVWTDAKDKEEDGLHPLLLDVTNQANIDTAYEAVMSYADERGLPLSGVVLVAGLGAHMPLQHHSLDDVRELFDVNVFGALAVAQRFLPRIRKDKGRLVLISSIAGKLVQPKEGAYAASKHAIEALGDALRQELGPLGVSVSLIEPGFVDTPILDKILKTEDIGNTSKAAEVYPYLYEPSYRTIFEKGKATAGAPRQVAQAIHSALTSRYPATRYAVTSFQYVPAWLVMRFKWLLNDRLFDKIVSGF